MRIKNLIIAFLLNFIGGLGFVYLRDIRPLINILIVNVLVLIFFWIIYFVGVLTSTDLAIFGIICIFGSIPLLFLYSIIKIWQLSKPDIRANKDKLGFKNGYIFVLLPSVIVVLYRSCVFVTF